MKAAPTPHQPARPSIETIPSPTPGSTPIEGPARLLRVLYLVWALPLLLTLCWLTPPWQNPDEAAHLLRAEQVAQGGLIGQRHGAFAGGIVDSGVLLSRDALASLPVHPQVRLRAAMLDASGAVPWVNKTFLNFPNTAQYPPFLYLPQAAAIGFGQAAHLSIVLTLRLARAAAAITATLICAAALGIARRTAPMLAIIAMLPMNQALFASVSQDGLMLACVLLAVALLDRIATEQRDGTSRECVAVAGLLALVGMARPPYVPLALLCLLLTRRPERRALWSMAAVAGCVLAWIGVAAVLTTVPMHGASLRGQLQFGLTHPRALLAVAQTTWRLSAHELGMQLIGKLGWLDTPLAPWFYPLAGLLLGLGLVCTLGGSSRRPLAALAAVLAAGAAVIAAEYLVWSNVGAPSVVGLQGRYFDILLAAASLTLPGFPALARSARAAGFAGVALLAALTPLVMLKAIVWRYYLG